MNDSMLAATHTQGAAKPLIDEQFTAFSEPDLILDEDIDYDEIAAATQPGQPGGKVVLSSDDFDTDDEFFAALEAMIAKDLEGLHDGTLGKG